VKLSFDGYTLQRRIAWGGMSVVFAAKHGNRDKEFAIKLLSDEYCDKPERVADFEKEGQMTASVRHRNVVRAYGVGYAYGRPYMAMELVEGKTLEEMLAKKSLLSEKRAIEIALQAIDGLQAARKQGLIHRDIKPGNILLGPKGVVKIIDFGLSVVTADGQARSKEIFATPYYVSPEALQSSEEDFRSDIYALGATLFHALAGSPPFETTSTDIPLLYEMKRSVPPLGLRTTVDRSLALVVNKAMAFDREDRFASYADFSHALREAAEGKSMVPQGPRRSQRREISRLPVIFATIGILAFVAIVGLAFQWLWEGRTSSEGPEVQTGVQDASAPSVALQETLAKASAAVHERDLVMAEKYFAEVARSGEFAEPTVTRAALQAPLCALLDGRPGDARSELRFLQTHLRAGRSPTNLRMPLERRLDGWFELGLISLPDVAAESDGEALVNFLVALRNWEQGERAAAGDMRDFADRDLSEEGSWMAKFQDFAASYLADAERLSQAEPEWGQLETDRTTFSDEQEKLERLLINLETEGRAPFEVQGWLSWIKWQQN
jgi:serine/threonine protein kinase